MNNDLFNNNENSVSDESILNNTPEEILEPIPEINTENISNSNEILPVENNLDDNVVNSNEIYYKCNDCNLIYSKMGENKGCIYCGKNNLNIIDNNILDIPYIIPFKIDKDSAINNYKSYFKFNPLVPNIFKNKNTISSISKIYISSELYDVSVSGNISFFGGDKTDNEEVKKFDIKDSVNFDYKNILVSSNSKISNEDFNCINDYNLELIQSFNNELVDNDTSIIYSDLSPMDITNNISNMVMDYSLGVIKKNINHQMKKIRDNKLAVNFSNNKTVLVPLYLLNVNYKDNSYLYLMNGQTGKVKFTVTYGKKEIIITSILLFILVFIISLLFVYFI